MEQSKIRELICITANSKEYNYIVLANECDQYKNKLHLIKLARENSGEVEIFYEDSNTFGKAFNLGLAECNKEIFNLKEEGVLNDNYLLNNIIVNVIMVEPFGDHEVCSVNIDPTDWFRTDWDPLVYKDIIEYKLYSVIKNGPKDDHGNPIISVGDLIIAEGFIWEVSYDGGFKPLNKI